jgi:hypothetical protein
MYVVGEGSMSAASLEDPPLPSPGWYKIEPNFDPLRKNPRFQRLVAGGK